MSNHLEAIREDFVRRVWEYYRENHEFPPLKPFLLELRDRNVDPADVWAGSSPLSTRSLRKPRTDVLVTRWRSVLSLESGRAVFAPLPSQD